QLLPPRPSVCSGLGDAHLEPPRKLTSERGPVVHRNEPPISLEPDRPPADLPPPDLSRPRVDPFHAQLTRDALGTRPPTQGPRDRRRVLYGHLSAVHRLFALPVAPEPARPLSGLLPWRGNAVLVLLRRERSVLGEIHRDPTRISRLQPLVPVNAGSGQTVTTAFLQVGVTDDVGPHLRQPRPEFEP